MKSIFDHIVLGGVPLQNRAVRSATHEELADADGHITPALFALYEELAKGGVGLIITSFSNVLKEGQPSPGMMGMYDDSFIEENRRLTDMIHQAGKAKVFSQIVYGGSSTSYNLESGRTILGPSAVKNPAGVTPKECTKEDIAMLQQAFADSVVRVKNSGFDGVQLHFAHGYGLSHWLTPFFNRRTDEYGGRIENRARMLLEVFEKVRQAVGKDFHVSCKINSMDFHDQGLTLEDCIYVCKRLDELGIDSIEVSGGSPVAPPEGHLIRKGAVKPYLLENAKAVAREVSVPVISVGGYREFEDVEAALNQSDIEAISFSRPLLREPDLIARWEAGDRSKSKCISCNGCMSNRQAGLCKLRK